MTVTVSGLNYTQISGCESTSDGGTWTGIDTQDGDNKKEGSYSLCGTLKGSGDNDAHFVPSASVDLSGTKHVRFWIILTQGSLVNTYANGGIQFYASDGSNTGYWYVGGRDTYPGGWYSFVVDVSQAVDAGTKPTNMNAITSMGIRINLTGTGKNVDNTWIDNLCVCDGLITYGDDAGGYYDFEDIYNVDNDPANGGWGIVTKFGGVYYLTGAIQFGDASGTNGTKFQAKNQIVIFEDRGANINSNLMEFEIVDNGTGTTEFILGEKSGSSGINGCTISVQDTAQSSKFDIDGSTDTDVDNFKLYGSTFIDADSISFPSNAATVEILNCSFNTCGEVLTDTAVVKYCNFVSANGRGCRWSSTSHNVDNCVFISCGHGVHCNAIGSFESDNNQFVGCTYDIENSTDGSVEIAVVNTPTNSPATYENTGSGSTSISNNVTVSIHAKDEDGNNVASARVLVEADSGGSLPAGDSVSITRSGSTATVSHTAHGMSTDMYVVIRGADQQEYNGDHQITVTGVDAYTYTVSGTPDTPATGTITATARIINELTSAGGIASELFNVGSDQPITGTVRKSSGTPYYKSGTVSGSITSSGYSATIILVGDE